MDFEGKVREFVCMDLVGDKLHGHLVCGYSYKVPGFEHFDSWQFTVRFTTSLCGSTFTTNYHQTFETWQQVKCAC